jgi:hemerythrin-like domain-containing protein
MQADSKGPATTRPHAAGMHTNETPDLSGYYAIHRQQRVDTARYVQALDVLEQDDVTRRRALARWATGFGHELTTHHTIEDEVFFPDLAMRVPATTEVLRRLATDHETVEHLIGRLRATGAGVAEAGPGAPFAIARAEALEVAVALRDLLIEHLDVEDDLVLSVFAASYSAEEYEALQEQAIKSIPKTGLFFSIPWNVACLDEEARVELIRSAPLPLRLIYRLSRGRFDRLVDAAFAGLPVPVAA